MIHYTNDGKAIYYEVAGNAAASETVVFLNGLTQSVLSWSMFVPFFQEKYRIVLMDFVFQGRSSKEGEWRNFDQHAADVAGLIKHVCGEPVCVVGLSYGSIAAQHLLVNYPAVVKRAVLMSGIAHKTPYYEAVEKSWWSALETGGFSLMLDVMMPMVLSEQYFANPIIPIEQMKQNRRDMSVGSEALFKLMRATKEREDYRQKLSQIKKPVLVLHGEMDRLFPLELGRTVAESIPGAVFNAIKGAGHTLNLEKVPIVCEAILSFLK
jgi:3-oxoadipate enol-lactonase